MRESGSRALIVHGSYGSPDENWAPWLRHQFERSGVETFVPQFPTPEGQSLASWRRVLEKEVGVVGQGWVLVGHSLGVAFLLDALERCPSPVDGFFSVSGFTGLLGLEEFDMVNSTFVQREFDWDSIRAAAASTYVYHGEDDPYVPVEWSAYLAEKLGAVRKVVPKGGHLNAGAGFSRFDMLWSDISSVLAAAPDGD